MKMSLSGMFRVVPRSLIVGAICFITLAENSACAQETPGNGKSEGAESLSAERKSKDGKSSVKDQQWFDPNAKLNHLANETSPYLLSHADNPVDWYPWGEEALEKARREKKLIFLSIGYASCHWCHVMEHESFEDQEIADMLNKNFVSIKVDREERPDLDQIYMTAVQIFTRGGGGWPMTVIMTPDLKPFFAATYLPKESNPAMGRLGLKMLLTRVTNMYEAEDPDIFKQADAIAEAIQRQLEPYTEQAEVSAQKFDETIQQSVARIDFLNGGFGEDKKFPHHSELAALLRAYALSKDERVAEGLEKTLTAMAGRGMYDQVGGGFHRYTVDRKWNVPHFEKMLYDNALLVPVYADAYLLFSKQDYLDAVTGTLDFLLREMHDPAGGFYSALDADSDGEEGLFYVWEKSDVDSILGSDTSLYYTYYKYTEFGNFEGGTNVPAKKQDAWDALSSEKNAEEIRSKLADLTRKLFDARSERVRPLTDDKVIAAWNGMALTAFSRGYQVTGDEKYLRAAQRLGSFLKDTMYRDGSLAHMYRHGEFSTGKFLEDYAYVANGMVDLYESDGNVDWLLFAKSLCSETFNLFTDSTGFFYLSEKSESDHIVRPSDIYDGSYPAPGSYALLAAQRVTALTDDKALQEKFDRSMATLSGAINKVSLGMVSALLVYHNQFIPRAEFAIVGPAEKRREFLREVYRRYFPYRIIAQGDGADDRVALLRERNPLDENSATGFVCRNYVCQLPAADVNSFSGQLDRFTLTP